MKRLVVFASGSGSNFKAIYNNIKEQKIKNANIELLVSNNPQSGAVLFAKNNSIDTFIVNQKTHPDKVAYIKNLNDKLLSCEPHLIILAGYMKLIPREVVEVFNNKIINIHPGKLPDFGGKGFYGLNVHNAVLRSKVKSTAVTIHYVNEEYDKGLTIHEEPIEVYEYDTAESLSERVLSYEHKLYSRIINQLINKGENE
tara:strand:+ start:546 stop:1142 length:597 start_codon:yes stop_codon:yes gene_type:complete